MCGRYLLRKAPVGTEMSWKQYHDGIGGLFAEPRYNISPGQKCIVIRNVLGEIRCDLMNWGYKPGWSERPPAVNSKAENLFSYKLYRDSIKHRRCLIIADGFYEPKGFSERNYRPWHVFQYADQKPFAMAGIWIDEGFSLVTNAANKQVNPIHHRMPHILEPEGWEVWLDGSFNSQSRIAQLLQPREYTGLENYAVGDYVHHTKNQGPDCIKPAVGQRDQLDLFGNLGV